MAESFADLSLAEPLLAAVREIGLEAPNEMQSRLIGAILGRSDVMACVPSGAGGTTGYLLGLVQRLLVEEPAEGRGPRALVLAPTRDQAMQIGRMIKQLGHDTRLRFGTVVGGRPYPTQHQLLRRPLDILVATPGRLMDHVRRGRVPFERLRFLLLDQADRMLDMGLGGDIHGIVEAGGGAREQTVILSGKPGNDAVNLLGSRLTHDPVQIRMDDAGHPLPPVQVEEASDLLDDDDRQPPGLTSSGDTASSPARRRFRTPRGGRRPRNPGNNPPSNVGRQGKPAKASRPALQGDAQKQAAQPQARNKPPRNGVRGPGRRVAGQGGKGRRPSNVRFPSDYASGPSGPARSEPVEPRGPKPNEPVQYSADYGFSVAPGARKPVNVVYRTKTRRRREEGDDVEKTENGND